MNNPHQAYGEGGTSSWLPGFLKTEAPEKVEGSRRQKRNLEATPAHTAEKIIGTERFHLGGPLSFDQIFSPRSVERHVNAPFLEERLRFLRHLASQGAARETLRINAYKLMTIVEYLPLERKGEIGEKAIKKAIERWANRQPQLAGMRESRHEKNSCLSLAMVWLGFLGRLRQPEISRDWSTHMVEEFTKNMSEEKGLSSKTIEMRRYHVTQFLVRFDQQHRLFKEITMLDIDAAIALKRKKDTYARSSIKIYASCLRIFLRFAEKRGWCAKGLAEAIMTPRVFADEGLPQGPSWTEVLRLLAFIEGPKPSDIRDRALILLYVVYGLRASEITNLKLEDIDWENELLDVTCTKSRRSRTYPLQHAVGEALLRYLKEVRPRVSCREIFISMQAPFKPLSRVGLSLVVARHFRTLEIISKKRGAHSLRHACATHLQDEGLSINEIGDHLGHRSPDSTRIYAKVDLKGLRLVADFDLGGVL